MIGRDAEVSIVDDLVRSAREGRSGALVVSGEPGIGKTLLLAYARSVATGSLLLEAAGSQAESRLAFAGLADLLAPILDHLDELPEPQAEALRGALALGPSLPGDRFTAYAAVLRLLAAAAETGPVVCIVDDAHWLDAESLEALLFTARRIGAEGVAMILATRRGASELIESSTVPRLQLEGLGTFDAGRLVARTASLEPARSVLATLVSGAAGNPMALVELGGALSAAQLTGAEPLPDPLPVGAYLERALLRPLANLPPATRRALLVASADDGAAAFLGAALEVEGLATSDLEPAERAGVIAVGPTRAVFSHPLVRAAVYQAASPPDRRSVHRAHAVAAAGFGDVSALDRRAWHLALASAGPDEDAAAELERAGGRAAARSAFSAACEAFEAAARLSPDLVQRGRRLGIAGQNALRSGAFPRASALLDEVITLDADPVQVLEAMAGRGHSEMWGGSVRRAVTMLVAAAEQVQAFAPPAAAALLAQASLGCQMRASVREALDLAQRADTLAASAPPEVRAIVESALAAATIFRGGRADLRPEVEQQLARQAASGDPIAYFWAVATLHLRMLEENYDETLVRVTEFVAAARARSTPSALPYPLTLRADLLLRIGRLDEARADAAEAAQIADETGQDGVRGYAYGTLARAEAVLGRGDDCRRHAAAGVEGLDSSEADSLPIYADAGLGLLALSEGDLHGALAYLTACSRRYNAGGNAHPLLVPFAGDLIETQIRLGRGDEAERDLIELERLAETCDAALPRAIAARCRGLMASIDDIEHHFAIALAQHELTPIPFERGRTLLCLGERRRRARRARDSRDPLESALEIFEGIGAAPWAEWARRELRATGARPREARPAITGELTSQELQVALAVARGVTNKEAATALLISPKTVEYHLGRVYSKLGVRSRAELASRMASPPEGRVPDAD